tara:strand:- start:50 stop:814 length:765 start_codon:yes stop_codon:yes gene_type:complete
MEYELTTLAVFLLLTAGLVCGFVNTIAGGGSMFTIPALLFMGMPADIANATNRVGVLLGSLVGVQEFHSNKYLDTRAVFPVLLPTLVGALSGATLASYLPIWLLEPFLLMAMISMAIAIIFFPSIIIPSEGTRPYELKERSFVIFGLFATGFYGGFVQAGVGFILIFVLAGGLRYDLLRTNALKMVCTGAFCLVALVVFTLRNQVLWIPGLILALGTVSGTIISVKFALNVSNKTLKWFTLVMAILVCLGALFN